MDIEPVPFLWIEEGKEEAYTPRTRRPRAKKRKEFVGWGSKQLIEFLDSIGRDTSKILSQHDITEIINRYVTENKLINPEKKKRVLCDERLHALFGRKSIGRVKIYDLLEPHLAENDVNSDDDLFSSSEEKEEESVGKRRRVSSTEKRTYKKKVPEVLKTCMASITAENIKLVYLKKTLVQELLKHPETFEVKVVGSYVRIKSDPHDIFQKHSHQLELVTGVKTLAATGDTSSCTLLQISGMTYEIRISELSDDNFSEEECEDLHRRMKDGLIKQPTVGELEQKVIALHEDITRHWITRELALLKNLIDRANEKGWRHRVMEYLDRRRLLQTPSEQSRLLSEIPKVRAEENKPETVPEDSLNVIDENVEDSPKAADWDWGVCYDSSATEVITNIPSGPTGTADIDVETRNSSHAQSLSPEEGPSPEVETTKVESNGHVISSEQKEWRFAKTEATEPHSNGHRKPLFPQLISFSSTQETKDKANSPLRPQSCKDLDHYMKIDNMQSKRVEVIDLSDDEEGEKKEQEVPYSRKQIPDPIPELLMWHYFDPHNNVQGPFSLSSLKRWRDAKYFPPNFRVWRTAQSPREAVLLDDVIHKFLPN